MSIGYTLSLRKTEGNRPPIPWLLCGSSNNRYNAVDWSLHGTWVLEQDWLGEDLRTTLSSTLPVTECNDLVDANDRIVHGAWKWILTTNEKTIVAL
jgi:hypothetical protein